VLLTVLCLGGAAYGLLLGNWWLSLALVARVASASMRDRFPAQVVIFAPEYGSEDEH
jgi:hypothetical protein